MTVSAHQALPNMVYLKESMVLYRSKSISRGQSRTLEGTVSAQKALEGYNLDHTPAEQKLVFWSEP